MKIVSYLIFLLSVHSSLSMAFSANLMIADSGVDFEHHDLKKKIGVNPRELKNLGDDDSNGFLDDIHGWNFIANNSDVFGNSRSDTFPSDLIEISRIYAKHARGGDLSSREWDKVEAFQSNSKKRELFSYLNVIAHGTHVAGIASKDVPNISIFSSKIIGSGNKPNFFLPSFSKDNKSSDLERAKEFGRDSFKAVKKQFKLVRDYQIHVYNGSYGRNIETIKRNLKDYFSVSDERLAEIVRSYAKGYREEASKFLRPYKNTLFVFAAGNDKVDIGQSPEIPAGIKSPNVITVAASIGRNLADFSNFSSEYVDIAAPGVGINAAGLGGKNIYMSGTSMAAPYVANVAIKMKNVNPSLSAEEIKIIIMETVDKVSSLKYKVKSSGIINASRAIQAAKDSKSFGISKTLTNIKMNQKGLVDDLKEVKQRTPPFILNLGSIEPHVWRDVKRN